ncbi:MAG: glycosyltransferase [Prevotellaceae bacterium]|jgi:glycosyltransferase involved in cell wall biosynthesis|nr:glycosyltransferase [Prevotellaceae bacterium]
MNTIISIFAVEELLLLAAVLALFIIEVIYWLRVFGRVAFRRISAQPVTGEQLPVSIILSARNECELLQKTLPLILEQDYPEFEVVVVNDGSDDDTEILLASMQGAHPRLVFRAIVKDEKFRHNKKMALGVGIKAAKYDLLLFIDADCYPSGNGWLKAMQRYFTEKKDIVIGYTRLPHTARWMRADHFMQALHMLGKALLRKTYMGIHSNLAYRKSLFFSNKGFDMRVTNGLREDIVFINKTATRANTAVSLGGEATTVSTLHYSAGNWLRYRANELRSLDLSAHGPHYPALGETLCRLLFFAGIAGAAAALWNNGMVLLLLAAVLFIRFTLQVVLFIRAQKRLGEKGLLPILLLWDIFYPFYYLSLIFIAKINNKQTWR